MREGLAAWSGGVFRNLPQDPLGATEGPDPQPHPSLAMSWLVPWASALTSLGCPPLQGEDGSTRIRQGPAPTRLCTRL